MPVRRGVRVPSESYITIIIELINSGVLSAFTLVLVVFHRFIGI